MADLCDEMDISICGLGYHYNRILKFTLKDQLWIPFTTGSKSKKVHNSFKGVIIIQEGILQLRSYYSFWRSLFAVS